MAAFEISSEEQGPGIFHLSLSGSLYTDQQPELDQAVDRLLTGKPAALVFDLEHLEYLSSAGIGSLLKAEKALEETGGIMVLINLRLEVRKILELVGLLDYLNIVESPDDLGRMLDQLEK